MTSTSAIAMLRKLRYELDSAGTKEIPMAEPRLDYKKDETVQGLMVELTSALLSLSRITRDVTPDDVEHGRAHVMAGLELAKRLMKQQLK